VFETVCAENPEGVVVQVAVGDVKEAAVRLMDEVVVLRVPVVEDAVLDDAVPDDPMLDDPIFDNPVLEVLELELP